MIVKITGKMDGAYTEETYENVVKYRVALCTDGVSMNNGDIFSGGDTDFLRLTLFYSKTEFEFVYFNTVCYLMSADGVTIDILTYDKMMKKSQRG